MRPETPGGRWGSLGLLATGVLAADQVSKAAVLDRIVPGERVEVLPFVDLVRVTNEGVAFGLLGGAPSAVVLAITAAALALLLAWHAHAPRHRFRWLAIGLLAGGALGNLVDRLFRDGVVDFIDVGAWPSFNLADVAITLGAIALALGVLLHSNADQADPAQGGAGREGGC